MDQSILLMELEEAFERFSWGLNAVELMVLGLGQARDPYTGGFQAVWVYLKDAEEEVRRLLTCVSIAGTKA